MAVEIVTIPRVYLASSAYWRSAHHTAYCSPGSNPRHADDERPLLKLEFNFGVARNVEQNIYDAFVEAGIATTDRPQPRRDDD